MECVTDFLSQYIRHTQFRSLKTEDKGHTQRTGKKSKNKKKKQWRATQELNFRPTLIKKWAKKPT
uniref:Uncharacterized protein n=1 Tax=Rhizophora mucronata TaxID=61149 RepID=A0A2P2P196_RHIMU